MNAQEKLAKKANAESRNLRDIARHLARSGEPIAPDEFIDLVQIADILDELSEYLEEDDAVGQS